MRAASTTVFRNLIRVFGVLPLFGLATVSSVFADSITKSFEIGSGTPQLRSHVRTFPVPCGLEVVPIVKVRRLGADGSQHDIPIKIELRAPDTALGQEGPIIETKSANAKKTEQSFTLARQPRSARGCSLPWRVRVKHDDDGPAPSPTFGTIRFDFNGALRGISLQYDSYALGVMRKGTSIQFKVGKFLGLEQGIIDITANWRHILATDLVTGPNPVRLKWELINPNGTVVKTITAYSSNEARNELPKFKLVYQVTSCVVGQWKLRVTNNTNDDAAVDYKKAELVPGCPN